MQHMDRCDCCASTESQTADAEIQKRATQFKALGDKTRLRLALMIRNASPAPVCACSFPETFGMSQSTLSHHLTKLVDAGVLHREQRGRWAYFTLDAGFDASILGPVENGTPMTNDRNAGETTILFACRQNAGRSQMAAALAKSLAPAGVRIISAGTDPADNVHPIVVDALAEIGLEPESQPKPLDPSQVKTSDWVITMGCGEHCPIFPGVHYEDWEITDPHGKSLDEVRAILAELRERVIDLLGRVK